MAESTKLATGHWILHRPARVHDRYFCVSWNAQSSCGNATVCWRAEARCWIRGLGVPSCHHWAGDFAITQIDIVVVSPSGRSARSPTGVRFPRFVVFPPKLLIGRKPEDHAREGGSTILQRQEEPRGGR